MVHGVVGRWRSVNTETAAIRAESKPDGETKLKPLPEQDGVVG